MRGSLDPPLRPGLRVTRANESLFRPGDKSPYFSQGHPAVSPEFKQLIQASVAEVGPPQIDIYRRLTPAARFRQGSAISDTARHVAAYRMLQEHPELGALEANRMVLQRAYASNGGRLGALPSFKR
jgi:hypothetical protein